MQTNTDCTIYNRYVSSGEEVYQRTQITGVAWQGGKGRTGAGSSNQQANQVTVYIPSAGRSDYVTPKAWAILSNKSGKWTLQPNDVIVKGLVNDTIAPPNETGAITLSALKAKYDDVLVISDVQTMDYGSLSMQHWQVTAK